MRRVCLAVFLACATSAAAVFAQAAPTVGQYYVYDVGTVVGELTMFRINQSGSVLWNSNGHSYVYKSCRARDIGSLGGGATVGRGINNNGEVVGKSRLPDGRWRAFRYANGIMHDLGGGASSPLIWEEATAITFWGDIAGVESVQGTLAPTAVRYSGGVATPMVRFQTPQGMALVNTVDAVTDSGDVAGSIRSGGGAIAVRSTNFGYLWQQVKGVPGLDFATFPFGMNMYGHITGAAGNGFVRAFLSKDPSQPAADLGTLGGSLSQGLGINSYDWVVGWAEASNGGGPRAFVHDGTAMVDLNTRLWNGGGWLLREAMGINDAGQIVGEGILNGKVHAFLLQPMPRPPGLDPCSRIVVGGGVFTQAK